MPRSATQNEQMRQATRRAIIDSAMALFAQNGFAHTSTRQIAKAAGISTGLIYHYYSSKEQLLQAVFDDSMQRLSMAFAAALEGSEAGQERVAALVKTIFELLARDPAFWTLFYALRSQPAIARLLGNDLRLWTQRLRDLFATELAHAGSPDAQLDALLLYSLIEGTIQQYLLDPQQYPLQTVVRRIVSWVGG